MPLPPGDRWLLKEEVISMLYMSDRTLQRWRSEGIIPYSKIGNKIWYRLSDIIKLLESRMM
jgi:predicted site-specific integrase-resolvase